MSNSVLFSWQHSYTTPGLINTTAPSLRPGLEYMFMERPAEYMGCFILHAWEGGVSFSISFLPQFTSLCLYLPQFAFTENLTKNTTFPWILFLETCHKKKKKRLRILL